MIVLYSVYIATDGVYIAKPNHFISLKVVGSLGFRKTNHSAHFSNKYKVLK